MLPQMADLHSGLWLNSISTVCVCVYIIYVIYNVCIIYIYYIFFIHLSVDKHLGGFLILALVNSTAINMGAPMFLQLSSFPLNIYPVMGLLDHICFLFFVLIFKKYFYFFFWNNFRIRVSKNVQRGLTYSSLSLPNDNNLCSYRTVSKPRH